MKLFVRNLPYSLRDEDLKQIFERAGTIVSAKVVMDRETGRSRGFGFVEFSTEEEGKKAIQELNGFSIQGRSLEVDKAKDPVKGGAPRR